MTTFVLVLAGVWVVVGLIMFIKEIRNAPLMPDDYE
jgi:hypothetical protein